MSEPLQVIVGRNVRRIRVARGYSQEAFADEVLGVHRTYASRLERGITNLSLAALERLAKTLGVDPRILLSEDMTVEVRVTDGRE
ncbi:helix-turn-helix domain-containing protein [Nocardia cyriacigeorgica]|uniref:helix-turn-helix domain-containing protein n=1 Tax=Nocardia cyriacigeorgica TaxID=135487 RepID=UPI00245549A3|nr:helix-turn-helix transcriptional regulator [Nocardia cyriacigeorgica]